MRQDNYVPIEPIDEGSIRAYLTGGLTPSERRQIEERYFLDDGFFEYVSALEEELAADYIRRVLRADEMRQFEAHLARSPGLQTKVESLRTLMQAVRQRATAQEVPARKRPWRAPGWLFAPFPLGYAAVIGVAVAVASSWTAVHVIGLRQTIAQLDTRAAALERSLAERHAEAAPAFLLMPGVTKSAAAEQQRLFVPPDSSRVRFTLDAASAKEFSALRAALRTVDRNLEVWSGDVPAPVRTAAGWRIEFEIPVVVLSHDDFVLTLYGLGPNSEAREVETYSFGVATNR